MFTLLINNAFSKTHVTFQDSTANDSTKNSSKTFKISESAPESKVKYIARDSIEVDNEKQIVRLVGDAKVEYGDLKVEADIIKVYITKNEVEAFGLPDSTGKIKKVKFKDGDQEFEAPAMHYNFNSKKGKIIQVVTQEGGTYLHAEKAKKMPNNNIFIASGKITTCDAEDPHFYFHASKLKVIPGKNVIAGPTNLQIRGLPTPIWVPFGIFPNNSKKQSGILIPAQGVDNKQFGLKELGFHWAINDYIHAEILADIYFSQTYRLNGKLDYRKRYKYNGTFQFRYNNLVTGVPETSNHSVSKDMSLRWTYVQDVKAHPKRNFSIDIDAKTPTFNKTQNLTTQNAYTSAQAITQSSINFGYRGKGWSVNSSAKMTQNFTTKIISTDLPNITFNKNPYKLFKNSNNKFLKNLTMRQNLSFYNSLTAGDSVFFNAKSINKLQNGARIQHKLDVGTSYKILKYFNLTLPGLTVNQYFFSKTQRKTSIADSLPIETDTIKDFRHAYDVSLSGLALNTKIYGLFSFGENTLIKKIRHTMTPQVSIAYNTDYFARMQGYIYDVFDKQTKQNLKYSIYDNSRYLPNGSNQLNLNYGLLNILEAKVKQKNDSLGRDKKVPLLNSFNLNGSYNALADSLHWSNYTININANPWIVKNLNINFLFSPYELDDKGNRIADKLLWTQNKFEFGRLIRAGFNFGVGFDRLKVLKTFRDKTTLPKDNFNWTFEARYAFDMNASTSEKVISNSLAFSGKVDFTKNWRMTYNLPIDIESINFANYSSFGIERDLHCWTMSVSWLPFSTYTNYTFSIRPKSGLLQDLKYEKRRP